jgi:hypothetical protein
MENVTYQTSGALNRNHFALVSKQEHALSSQEADKATWECFHSIKRRMTRPSNGTASSFSGLLAGVRGWGLDIPTSSGWDSVSLVTRGYNNSTHYPYHNAFK